MIGQAAAEDLKFSPAGRRYGGKSATRMIAPGAAATTSAGDWR